MVKKNTLACLLAVCALQEAPKLYSETAPCIASLSARHIESGGVGYKKGYTTLEGLLFPLHASNYIWPFLDLRAHRFDNNEYAANAGIGFRMYTPRSKTIIGFNSYYDYRSNHFHKAHYSQIGVGMEVLMRPIDVRVNGYFPLKKWVTLHKCVFDDFIGDFFAIKKRVEEALDGGDLEIGRSVFEKKNVRMYAAAATYYYERECRHTWGGKFRINLNFFNHFFIDGSITHDPLFRTRVQGQIGFNFPLGCSSKHNRLQRRLTQPIQRHEIIVLDRYCRWRSNF